MRTLHDNVTQAIVDAGLDIKEFVDKELNISYQMFRYRIRRNMLLLEHYHKIMHATNKTFDELWPSPLNGHRKKKK